MRKQDKLTQQKTQQNFKQQKIEQQEIQQIVEKPSQPPIRPNIKTIRLSQQSIFWGNKDVSEKEIEKEYQKQLTVYNQKLKEYYNPSPPKNIKNQNVWKELSYKLPIQQNPYDRQRRNEMFKQFDPNNNGFLSLAELDKGIRDVLNSDKLFKCKPAIMRAYQAAKNYRHSNFLKGEDYVERNEFRAFLIYLRQYFEYFIMFDRLDTGQDRRIDYQEFLRGYTTGLLKTWGVNITDPKATFNEIDKNKGGQLLFDEFADWAIRQNLDLEDDDNLEVMALIQQCSEKLSSRAEYIQSHKKQKPVDKIKPKSTIWQELNAKLPISNSNEDISKRNKMFKQFDPNGNGYLSLAEVDKGIRDVLNCDQLFSAKKAIMRAFQASKNYIQKNTKFSKDYIEQAEFRQFLIYLRQYFEFMVIFDEIDINKDKKLSKEEFIKSKGYLKICGIDLADPLKAFQEIDKNKGGFVLFDEFADWAFKKQLDLPDDDDFEKQFSIQIQMPKQNLANKNQKK